MVRVRVVMVSVVRMVRVSVIRVRVVGFRVRVRMVRVSVIRVRVVGFRVNHYPHLPLLTDPCRTVMIEVGEQGCG